MSSIKSLPVNIQQKIKLREQNNSLRKLVQTNGLIDFSSNDYLGFARSAALKEKIRSKYESYSELHNGSSGSRLLSGNSKLAEDLEHEIARIHNAEAAILYNSGYDANLGFFSCIASRHDTIIYDELIHASIIDGLSLSHAKSYSFTHNDLESLEQKLKTAKGEKFVAVESIYSMDGDVAKLDEIAELVKKYNGFLIVDEAHATGVVESKWGLVTENKLEDKVFARLHTYGKAMGVHGAAIVTQKKVKEFLVNFSRPFIYSTALPPHSLMSIQCAYELLKEINHDEIYNSIRYFLNTIKTNGIGDHFIKSNSAIQCMIIPGNEEVKNASKKMKELGFDVRPILSPTVKQGTERLRICLHTFNTKPEIDLLADALKKIILI